MLIDINKTIKNLESRGIKVILVNSRTEALNEILRNIPERSEIMNGSSTTLNEIGFTNFLKTQKKYKNLHKKILKETNQEKAGELRRKSVAAEYFLGSVNAISQNGELVACDNSGSRVGAYHFAAKNLILVAGINKITEDLNSAIERVRNYVLPLEDKRALAEYGMHSNTSKWIIIEKEIIPNRITLILVKEHLGF